VHGEAAVDIAARSNWPPGFASLLPNAFAGLSYTALCVTIVLV